MFTMTTIMKKVKNLKNINSILDSMKCSICIDTVLNPITFQCGHSICKYCLNASLKKCPTCRFSLDDVTTYKVNIYFRDLLSKLDNNYSVKLSQRELVHNIKASKTYKSMKKFILDALALKQIYTFESLYLKLQNDNHYLYEKCFKPECAAEIYVICINDMIRNGELRVMYDLLCKTDPEWICGFLDVNFESFASEVREYLSCFGNIYNDKYNIYADKIKCYHETKMQANSLRSIYSSEDAFEKLFNITQNDVTQNDIIPNDMI